MTPLILGTLALIGAARVIALLWRGISNLGVLARERVRTPRSKRERAIARRVARLQADRYEDNAPRRVCL